VPATANPPFSIIGQGVIQGGLQAFLYHLKDMHKLNSHIEQDMEFKRGLNLMQNMEFLSPEFDIA
jgi:hypothetical protein